MRSSTHQQIPDPRTLSRLFTFAAQLSDRWQSTSLQDLRAAAEAESSGIVFEAIRAKDCQRSGIVLSIVGADRIAEIEQLLGLVGAATSETWEKLSVLELYLRSVHAGGLVFVSQWAADGRRSALVLAASCKTSVELLQAVFNLPQSGQEVINV